MNRPEYYTSNRMGSYSGFEREAVVSPDGATYRLILGNMRAAFVSNLAVIRDSVFKPVVYRLLQERLKSIKIDTDRITDIAEYMVQSANVLAEIRSQLTLLKYLPAMTRSDTTSGLPFTRATMEGLLRSILDGPFRLPPIPKCVVAMVDFLTTPLQMVSARPALMKWAIYFLGIKPFYAYSNLEANIQNLISESLGLMIRNQTALQMVQPTMSLFSPLPPVNMNSTLGMQYAYYYPQKASGGTETGHTFGSGSYLYFVDEYGIPAHHPLVNLWRINTGTLKFTALNAPTGGYTSAVYAPYNGTSLTELPVSSTALDWMYAYAASQSRDHLNPFMRRTAQYALPFTSEAEHTQRLIDYLVMVNNGHPSMRVVGTPCGPDLDLGSAPVTRLPKQGRRELGLDIMQQRRRKYTNKTGRTSKLQRRGKKPRKGDKPRRK